MKRSFKWILPALGLPLLAGVGALIWHQLPVEHKFYTDADTIKAPLEAARVRDVLWQPPVKLSEIVNTSAEDYEPRLSWDGMTLFFVRGKAGANADIYFSRRTPSGWTEAEPLDQINSVYEDLGPEPSADGESLYFYTDRPGGHGGYDVWVSRRTEQGWQPATNLGPLVNSEYNDYGPALTPDGETLFFASNRPQPTDTRQPTPDAWPATVREDLFQRTYDLFASPITDRGAGQAQPLVALNTPFNEGVPCVSPTGDFVYFSSDRPGGEGGFDLYRARRMRSELDPPANLGPTLNTAANELDPGLTSLGYGLYFSSDRPAQRLQPDQPNDYNLYYTSSREVFLDIEQEARPPIDWAGLWSAILPNLIWALLALLLLLLLWALIGSMRDGKLSLLARCLIASLMLHLLLLMMMNFWKVTASVVSAFRERGEIRVALIGPTEGSDITAQIRGQLTEVTMPDSVQVKAQRQEHVVEPTPMDATASLLAARTPIEIADQPEVEIAASIAPDRVPEMPLPEPEVTHEISPTLPDLKLPNETRQISHEETPLAVQPAPASDSPLNRPVIRVPTSQPVDSSAPVALAPEAHASENESADESSMAAAPVAQDATTPPEPDFTGPPPIATLDQPPTLDVGLPTDTPNQEASEESSPTVAAADSNIPRRNISTLSKNPQIEDRLRELAPESADLSGGKFALAAAVEIQPIEAAPPDSSAISIADAQRRESALPLDALALPALEEAQTTESNESAPSVAAALPKNKRPPVANHGSAKRPNRPTLLAALAPESNTTAKPAARSLFNPDAAARDAHPTISAPAPIPSPTHLGTRSNPLALDVRLPSETQAPVTEFAQRAPENRRQFLERMGGSDETERAVSRALAWLAHHQSTDGSWRGDRFDDDCGKCGGETPYAVDVALTGLSLLSFLGAGHTHIAEGPYRENVERGLNWLRQGQTSSGYLSSDETMYSHGIAGIALSEAYGMTRDSGLEPYVRRAVDFIIEARNRRHGGWRYQPGELGDTSVLGWQVMALKSAQMTGLDVPRSGFDSAAQWLEQVGSETRPGLYAYQPDRRVSPSMTAEGMFVQQMLGVPRTDPRMRRAAAYISRQSPRWDRGLNTYFWYYATLALFHRQGEQWERWNESLTDQLLEHQRKTGQPAGSWDPEGEWAPIGGRVYQTAICTLMLEVYYRYLPMYSRETPIADAETPDYDVIGTIHGRVTDADTSDPIAGAAVRIDLPDSPSVVAISGPEGWYTLPAPQVPDHFALSASRAGYLPGAADVPAARLRGRELTQDFQLEPHSESVVALESEPIVHHLGNDRWDGRINSQFQKSAEGRSFTAEFELTAAQLAADFDQAAVQFLAKGVQCPHKILINDQLLEQRVAQSPSDGSFGEFVVPFDATLLVEGPNFIKFRAVTCQGDLDDFEFINVRIRLSTAANPHQSTDPAE